MTLSGHAPDHTTPPPLAGGVEGTPLTPGGGATRRTTPRMERLWLAAPRVAAAAAMAAILALILVVPVAFFLLQAVSPKLFSQGPAWLTLAGFGAAFTGYFAQSLVNSLWVSITVTIAAAAVATPLAWAVQRTDIPGRKVWPVMIWALLLMPTFLVAEGWQYLLAPYGLLAAWGLPTAWAYHAFFGPAGVVFVDVLTVVPFAYIAISAAMVNLGPELEDASRVHGVGRWKTAMAVLSLLRPALFSALAIGFAETMSDFGVASTLAASAHFPVATYELFQAIDSNPANFSVAAAISCVLITTTAVPLAVQSRALRKGSFAVVSGRRHQRSRRHLGTLPRLASAGAVTAFFLLALCGPAVGAFSGSLMAPAGSIGSTAITFSNYAALTKDRAGFGGALGYSSGLAVLAATVTAVLALAIARTMTTKSPRRSGRVVDAILVGSVALPGIVLGAGYIFAFNLPLAASVGLGLYGSTTLLALGYVATSLPGQARLITGPMAQIQESLLDAARAHGVGVATAWKSTALPLLARVVVWAWLVTFAKTLLELPVSEMLTPPGRLSAAVAINNLIGSYHYGEGAALAIVALGEMFAVVGLGLILFELLAPNGWLRAAEVRNG